jgi:2-succinyl-5-enolpyruvyl-6-hydroxy-3-cyclohexene-1-carboxylate synthase
MEMTDKQSCRILVDLLAQKGVKKIVLSPGSRNTPLIMAVVRSNLFDVQTVIDERSAAFIALGISLITNAPVAIICTSGTAVLNYMPAVAEAYYRQVPLIVISSDRPAEWINQDDSQTIKQYEVMRNIVKESYNIPTMCETPNQKWHTNRILNDAITTAVTRKKGPVHINIQLDEPLSLSNDVVPEPQRVIKTVYPMLDIEPSHIESVARELSGSRAVMIIVGFMAPNKRLNDALIKLSELPNVIIFTEAQSNMKIPNAITSIDGVMSIMDDYQKQELKPQHVITIGGAIVSRLIKGYLRSLPDIKHWHIGINDFAVDCFKCLDTRFETEPVSFMSQLTSYNISGVGDYSMQWHRLSEKSEELNRRFIQNAIWSDFVAMKQIMEAIPKEWNLQLSNGTVVRYAQLFPYSHINRIDCNRGVSGIDGCTSTAIGAALAYDNTTLLITGDMSAQYDLGALASNCIPDNFKIVVLNNGGGGIFRFIKSTSELPELEDNFVCDVRLPLSDLARGFGFEYFEVSSKDEMATVLPKFIASQVKSILNVITPGVDSANVLKKFFNRNK